MINKILNSILFSILLTGILQSLNAQNFELTSKDNNTVVSINIGNEISWSVKKYNTVVFPKVNINIRIDGKEMGKNLMLLSNKEITHDSIISPVLPLKNSKITDSYKELQFKFKGDFGVYFRVYNEGVAYRFYSTKKGRIVINSETLDIEFNKNTSSWFPEETTMYSHNERLYLYKKIDSITKKQFCSLPVMFSTDNSINVLYSESDVYDYPQMFLKGTGGNNLSAIFPKVVAETKPVSGINSDRNVTITKEHPYIANTKGTRTFPWRFFIISNDDATFIEQDMVYKLSRPSKIKNTDWIKPGKVAWDWWNANNIYNVDFEAGLNTATYKYFIDFAAQYNIEYVILDEGWTKSTTEILQFNPNIDVKELIHYGKNKGVEIILWCLWKPLDENMVKILETYKNWGAVGIKVDFMQRSDQYMVNSYEKIAKECAKLELLVDYHGAFKPSGLRRAYPNVVSYEAVKGNENNKWENSITPKHNLLLPFIRMAVGPMDYTPGAMRNTQKINHSISFGRPKSLGTRAHQVAMYIVFESSLQMLCDTPSAYLEDKNTIEFIAQIPTTWDITTVLHAKIGEYLVVARKKEDSWYIGAMNSWKKRTLEIDFSFLPKGNYEMVLFKDGINANTYAEDYKVEKRIVNSKTKIHINLANGGGWSAILQKI